MTQLEIYKQKCQMIWGDEFEVTEYIPGNKKLNQKIRIIIKDKLDIYYNVCPTHFLNHKKFPSGMVALDPNIWFKNKCSKIYDNKYDYSKVEYKAHRFDVIVKCKLHDLEFSQKANSHLQGHGGCIKCARIATTSYSRLNTEEFIKRGIAIHGDKYDYSKFNYVSCATPSTVICKIHGEFQQTPAAHYATGGCYECGKMNQPGGCSSEVKHNPDKITNIYFIKCFNEHEEFYKIGLSVNPVKRFYQIPYKTKMFLKFEHKIKFLYEIEQNLRGTFERYFPLTDFAGKHECLKITTDSYNEITKYLKNELKKLPESIRE